MKPYNLLIITIIAGIFLQCCNNNDIKTRELTAEETIVDTAQGCCPFLTKDSKGDLVLSWIKKKDSITNIFSYAVSKDQGKSFDKIIEIPGSNNVQPHGENMPKIIFKPTGEIIAVWGASNPGPANAYAGMVYYSQSFDEGKTWTNPVQLVSDSSGFDQRYFDVALLPNGEAAIVWLDHRAGMAGEPSALYFAETNGRSGFKNERLVSKPCCPCCRTDLFIDSKKNIHVLYRAIINDSIRDMVHTMSTDNGRTFSSPQRISKDDWVINGCPHTGPAISENKNGIQLVWFTAGGGAGIYYCHSDDDGKTFSGREMVSGSGAKHCQITSIANDQTLIVWNENLIKGDMATSRIGLEIRNADGSHPHKKFITAANSTAEFPVIKTINNKTAFVAYTETVNNKDYVKYQLVNL